MPDPSIARTPARPSPHDLLAPYPQLRPPVSTARAAVTIVLREGDDDVELLLIERAANERDPASGQVALPGGRVDARDGSLADTAVRELEEEVGIPPADVLDTLRFVRVEEARRFNMSVGVFAASLADSAPSPSPRSAVEVAHVFWIPRHELAVPGTPVEQLTSRGPAAVPATRYEGHVIWGFTRRVVRSFFGFAEEDDGVGTVFAPGRPAPDPPPS